MHLHFLRAIGTAMSMRAGIAADTAAALLFRILSQPTLLFPPLRHAEGVEVHHEPLGGYVSSYKKQVYFSQKHFKSFLKMLWIR
jgi:GIGANTEA